MNCSPRQLKVFCWCLNLWRASIKWENAIVESDNLKFKILSHAIKSLVKFKFYHTWWNSLESNVTRKLSLVMVFLIYIYISENPTAIKYFTGERLQVFCKIIILKIEFLYKSNFYCTQMENAISILLHKFLKLIFGGNLFEKNHFVTI
jgi:hypothetical protein